MVREGVGTMDGTDDHGQPLERRFSTARLKDRAIDELIGLGKGIIADKSINQHEASFMLDWLEANEHALDKWPANVLYRRVKEMMADGKLDENEKLELLTLLQETVGGVIFLERAENETAALPLTRPEPEILFSGKCFCFTGKFVYGSRAKCQEAVVCRAATVSATPGKTLDYLIIGSVGSSDWIHSSFGRKIEDAVELRNRFGKLAIVSERHWTDFVS